MATSRSWRHHPVEGPFRARLDEINELNQVFSDSFTERYRRDGMVGVRVPFLNPAIWRYAIEDAAEGAMLWRADRGARAGAGGGAGLCRWARVHAEGGRRRGGAGRVVRSRPAGGVCAGPHGAAGRGPGPRGTQGAQARIS